MCWKAMLTVSQPRPTEAAPGGLTRQSLPDRRTGVERVLLGSVAARGISLAPCLVMTVRGRRESIAADVRALRTPEVFMSRSPRV
jgi:hypothetical protein